MEVLVIVEVKVKLFINLGLLKLDTNDFYVSLAKLTEFFDNEHY